MSDQKLTFEIIEDWAYGRTVIELSGSDCDGDVAIFDNAVTSTLGVEGLLVFAADPQCLYRLYFANKFASAFLWCFRSSDVFPFHFSRLLGIKSKELFRSEREERDNEIYEVCMAVDSMRLIKDSAIQSLYKQLLDFRHDYTENNRDFFYKYSASLDFELFDVEKFSIDLG